MVELLKIGIIFCIVLILTFRKVKLWISLLAGTFLLGFLFQLPLPTIVRDLFTSAIDSKTLLLIGALVTILFFSNLLKETGRMNAIMEGFGHIFKDIRIVIALLPSMIGLMPIIGGALISAPMVVEGSDELKLSPERRTFINYWFRHIWEYILPTFPALILAAGLTGIPIQKLIWINLPLTLTAIASGIAVGFWGISKSEKVKNYSDDPSIWKLATNLLPLCFGLVLVVGLKVELTYAFGLTILGMVLVYRIEGRVIWRGVKQSVVLELLLTVVIVMGFKKVLESSQAISAVSATLSSSGIPRWLIAMLIPLLVGIMAGLTMAPIAISFPILIPFFQNDPHFLNYIGLAFASGICGDLLSPFHLCLILTKDYFRADLRGVYRFIWIPTASILMVALLMAFFR
jgi:hypothetical protein